MHSHSLKCRSRTNVHLEALINKRKTQRITIGNLVILSEWDLEGELSTSWGKPLRMWSIRIRHIPVTREEHPRRSAQSQGIGAHESDTQARMTIVGKRKECPCYLSILTTNFISVHQRTSRRRGSSRVGKLSNSSI